jgi:hypothetical protein
MKLDKFEKSRIIVLCDCRTAAEPRTAFSIGLNNFPGFNCYRRGSQIPDYSSLTPDKLSLQLRPAFKCRLDASGCPAPSIADL